VQKLRSVDCDKLAAGARLAARRIFDASNATTSSAHAFAWGAQERAHHLFGLPPPLSDGCHLFARKFVPETAEDAGIDWFVDCDMIGLAPHCV
jgi:hypothetical protein